MASKNTKWIVFGSVVLVLAILILAGPVMVKKYMRAKWENAPHYKTSNLLMNVSGKLAVSEKNEVYIQSDNDLYYVLEELTQDVTDKAGERCSVIGKFREAKNGETVAGNPVRLFIGVQKLVFPESESVVNNVEENTNVSESTKISAEEKAAKKARLRVEANTRLNKPVLFDVIKGSVSSAVRKDKDGNEYTAFILKDEFGDSYMLYKKGKDLSSLEGKNVIVLGREILPPSNMLLVVDETTFDIYENEVYDTEYNKLM